MLLLPDAVPCTCVEPRAHWFAYPLSPMFPYAVTKDAAAYRCIRCGREISLPFSDISCTQSVFGMRLYADGRCAWTCPIHGTFELPLSEVAPAFRMDSMLRYMLPCCAMAHP